jgi:hypothetical protein
VTIMCRTKCGFTQCYGFKQARDQMINSDSVKTKDVKSLEDVKGVVF